MKKGKSFLKKNYKNVLIIVLSIATIALAITARMIWLYHYNATPSKADLKYGLEDTYKNVEKLECKYYGKFKYSKLTYKYTCSFDYTKDEEIKSDKTCVDCLLSGKKWQCSISTSECFK